LKSPPCLDTKCYCWGCPVKLVGNQSLLSVSVSEIQTVKVAQLNIKQLNELFVTLLSDYLSVLLFEMSVVTDIFELDYLTKFQLSTGYCCFIGLKNSK